MFVTLCDMDELAQEMSIEATTTPKELLISKRRKIKATLTSAEQKRINKILSEIRADVDKNS